MWLMMCCYEYIIGACGELLDMRGMYIYPGSKLGVLPKSEEWHRASIGTIQEVDNN